MFRSEGYQAVSRIKLEKYLVSHVYHVLASGEKYTIAVNVTNDATNATLGVVMCRGHVKVDWKLSHRMYPPEWESGFKIKNDELEDWVEDAIKKLEKRKMLTIHL